MACLAQAGLPKARGGKGGASPGPACPPPCPLLGWGDGKAMRREALCTMALGPQLATPTRALGSPPAHGSRPAIGSLLYS